MKTSLRFDHTPRTMEKIKRRRRRKIKSPEQPVVAIVSVSEKESPAVPKWVSPQFDVHNQTPAEQWCKKPRRVKVTDIFRSDPKKPQTQRKRKTLAAVQNLKFDGEETRTCSCRKTGGRHLSRSKTRHHMTKVVDPSHKQPLAQGLQTLQSFSSEFVHGSSQNVMADDETLVTFRPEFVSTPCAKKTSTPCARKSTELKNTTNPNCHFDTFIPNSSPNVFRWCDDVFGVHPDEHQFIRSTVAENHLSPLRTPDLSSQDIDAVQASFEKLLVEHDDLNCTNPATGKMVDDDKSISVLASDTPTHNGDYLMPYFRPTT